ncbi:uncharacterized protein LOC132282265 [Cornus florida]|uniref:uncharacterized protein LOC132282265 n=1 Tax=Cornus florida TaxID=4283 RepID=UPI002897A1B2|nr:uncharacterized protein LOC132282265 [Cornus florida]
MDDIICKVCGLETESVSHLFYRCPRAKLVWKLSTLRLDGEEVGHGQWDRWWRSKMENWSSLSEEHSMKNMAAFLCWQIWKARNAWVFEQKCYENPIKWQAPPVDVLKVNTDASFCKVLCEAGGGMVLRDHRGKVLRLASFFFQRVSNPLVAEGLVLRKIVDQVIRWGYSHIVFEIDTEVIVKAAMLDGSASLLLRPLVEDIHEWLHHHPDFDLVYTPRAENEVAHAVVAYALQEKNIYLWDNNFTDFVLHKTSLDVIFDSN